MLRNYYLLILSEASALMPFLSHSRTNVFYLPHSYRCFGILFRLLLAHEWFITNQKMYG